MPDANQPFLLQPPVGKRHGVEVHAQIRSHLANRRQKRAFFKLAARYQRFYLVNELLI
jgi:hypothetical protein